MRKFMIKPNLKMQNFNIDYTLPSKVVNYRGEDIILFGRIEDIDAKFPNGEQAPPTDTTPDPAADVPVWPINGSQLIPASIAAGVNQAVSDFKEVAGVALSSVQGMFSALDSLAQGSSEELVALAELDKAIINAKAELGDISQPKADMLKAGAEGDISKFSNIADKDSLSGALTGKAPAQSRRLQDGKLVQWNIDKTASYRDVPETISVRVEQIGSEDVFERQTVLVRVYGDEAELSAKYGTPSLETQVEQKYEVSKPTTTLKQPSISTSVYDPTKGIWT